MSVLIVYVNKEGDGSRKQIRMGKVRIGGRTPWNKESSYALFVI